MMFFKMSGTVILPVPVKNWLSIPLWEVHQLCKFGKYSSSRRRNMMDKWNHMVMSTLCHQHLRRIALRHFTKRCICCLSFMTAPPLEKESSGSARVYEIFATKYIVWFTFSLLFWRQFFWNKLNGRKFFYQFSVQFCAANVISFSHNKEPLMRKTELRARENFVNKIISSANP